MRELTIGYVLDGARRGYNFTTPTDGIDPATLKAIWRGAMPRGQGWDQYPATTALKCFPLESGEAVICEVAVTDMVDEVGRQGIRQATIRILTEREYQAHLLDRLSALPAATVANAERKLTSHEWELLFKKYRDAKKPKSILKPQTILAYPYTPDGLAVRRGVLAAAGDPLDAADQLDRNLASDQPVRRPHTVVHDAGARLPRGWAVGRSAARQNPQL